MTEREEFEAHFGIPVEQRRSPSAGGYAQREFQMMWAGWQAARRATPDRDSIVEECAKVCEEFSADIDTGPKKRNRVIQAAMQGALSCAEAIRQTKTAPNGEKK